MTNQPTVVFRVWSHSDPQVWRDIELRRDQTLGDLHLAIQDAFELDNEHLYAFYMNGHAFDREFAYEGPSSDSAQLADDARLQRFSLPVNKRFLYLFDFGDELRHLVKVMSHGHADAEGTYPRVIGSEGKAPPQYHDWDLGADAPQLSEAGEDGGSGDGAAAGSGTGCEPTAGEPTAGEPEQQAPLAGPIAQQLEQLVPRVQQAIEMYQHRQLGIEDGAAEQTRAELAQAYALACQLLDIVKDDATVLFAAFEDKTPAPIAAWLGHLPDELSSAAMHEEALSFARRVYEAFHFELVRVHMPGFLYRSKREQEAHELLAQVLAEFPENAFVLCEAGELEAASGNTERAEAHFRDALKWAGSDMSLRARVLLCLAVLLEKAGRREAADQLKQQEDDYTKRVFPEMRARTPVRRQGPKVGRNDPCPCGSGKKSKKCCGAA